MKKLILSVLVAIFAALPSMAAQTVTINRETVKAAASDKAAYKALASRFALGQQLPQTDMITLYYGSVFQPGFKASQTYPDVLNAYQARDFTRALALAQKGLEADPTNLVLLFNGYGAAAALKNAEAAALMQNRLLQVCDLIFASGSGVEQDSPYMVVRPSDINEFLVKYIQPKEVKSRATISGLDAAMVALDGVDQDVIMYFNQFK